MQIYIHFDLINTFDLVRLQLQQETEMVWPIPDLQVINIGLEQFLLQTDFNLTFYMYYSLG